MNMQTTKLAIVGAMTAAGLALGGCVSTEDFEKHVADADARHNALSAHVDEINGRVTALDGKVNTVSQSTQAAQARADEAYKLAEGKFVLAELGRETVNFATGSAFLSDEAKAKLTALADRLKSENKNVYLEIHGHADVRGGKQSNRQLGRERAGAVGRYLSEQGVPGVRMQLGSWGEDQPKVNEKTSEAHAENRRVEIIIVG